MLHIYKLSLNSFFSFLSSPSLITANITAQPQHMSSPNKEDSAPDVSKNGEEVNMTRVATAASSSPTDEKNDDGKEKKTMTSQPKTEDQAEDQGMLITYLGLGSSHGGTYENDSIL